MTTERVQVFVIVRIDSFYTDEQERISIHSVLPTIEEARLEVDRLNGSDNRSESTYFMRVSRYYPAGRRQE